MAPPEKTLRHRARPVQAPARHERAKMITSACEREAELQKFC